MTRAITSDNAGLLPDSVLLIVGALNSNCSGIFTIIELRALNWPGHARYVVWPRLVRVAPTPVILWPGSQDDCILRSVGSYLKLPQR